METCFQVQEDAGAGMWLFLFHVIEKAPCEKHEASDDLVSCGNERIEVSLDLIGFKV